MKTLKRIFGFLFKLVEKVCYLALMVLVFFDLVTNNIDQQTFLMIAVLIRGVLIDILLAVRDNGPWVHYHTHIYIPEKGLKKGNHGKKDQTSSKN